MMLGQGLRSYIGSIEAFPSLTIVSCQDLFSPLLPTYIWIQKVGRCTHSTYQTEDIYIRNNRPPPLETLTHP